MFGFAPLFELQHYFHQVLQVSLSPLIAVVTATLLFESFVLDHTTFAVLLETTLFFQKSMQSLSISSHTWLPLIVVCHYTNIILCRPLFSNGSLMTTGPKRPNHRTPARQETFVIHSSLIHAIIRYICTEHFAHRS